MIGSSIVNVEGPAPDKCSPVGIFIIVSKSLWRFLMIKFLSFFSIPRRTFFVLSRFLPHFDKSSEA